MEETTEKNLTTDSKGVDSKKGVKKQPVSTRVEARKRAQDLRKSRVSIEKQNLISIDQEPGWHYRRFNDSAGRIESYKKHGYEIVESKFNDGIHRSKDASQMGSSAAQDVGGGMKAYYMRIPQEIYDEDQKRKQRKISEREEQIAANSLQGAQDVRTKKSFRNYNVPGKGMISSSVSYSEDDKEN